MKQKTFNYFKKLLDVGIYKDKVKKLEKQIKEQEEERKLLIDLKNKYLTELRVKNLEVGRLKKQIEELKK